MSKYPYYGPECEHKFVRYNAYQEICTKCELVRRHFALRPSRIIK